MVEIVFGQLLHYGYNSLTFHLVPPQINSNGAGYGNEVVMDVTAYSPTGRPLPCPVTDTDGVFAATFQVDFTM